MSVSDLRAISELALYSAFGVICAFVLSLTLLVGFAARAKHRPASVDPADSGWLLRFIEWTADGIKNPELLKEIKALQAAADGGPLRSNLGPEYLPR